MEWIAYLALAVVVILMVLAHIATETDGEVVEYSGNGNGGLRIDITDVSHEELTEIVEEHPDFFFEVLGATECDVCGLPMAGGGTQTGAWCLRLHDGNE